MAGPGDEIAAGRGHLRASHADRERVLGILKEAFVHGMLAKDELDLRVGQTLAARTYAELAALTADLPAMPAMARPPQSARAEGERRVARPGPVIAAATAVYAGVWSFTFMMPWATNDGFPQAIVTLFFSATVGYMLVMAIAVGHAIAGWRQKRSRRQLPAGQAPGEGTRIFLSAAG